MASVFTVICSPRKPEPIPFWIASDDYGVFQMSTTTNRANATTVCSVPGWTTSRQWDKYSAQMGTRSLVSGQYYYVSAQMKEGAGGDNLAIRWRRPNGTDQVIPASHFRIQAPGGDPLPVNDPSSTTDQSDTIRIVDLSPVNQGDTVRLKAKIIASPANAAKIMWNNGVAKPNAIIRVFGANGGQGELTLTDTASNESNKDYIFLTEKRPRTLTVRSEVLGTGRFVSNYTVRVLNSQGGLIASNQYPAGNISIDYLSDGMRVEIAAAGEVYLGANTNFLYDSSNIPPDASQNSTNPPRQRYVATGLSVNNTPQTGDPTQYAFDLNGDTEVDPLAAGLRLLTINHDFSATESPERDPLGGALGGTAGVGGGRQSHAGHDQDPLDSKRAGGHCPDRRPGAGFQPPGLDIRYVPKAYRAAAAPRRVFNQFPIRTNRFSGGPGAAPASAGQLLRHEQLGQHRVCLADPVRRESQRGRSRPLRLAARVPGQSSERHRGGDRQSGGHLLVQSG
jgi:hypothetical protein